MEDRTARFRIGQLAARTGVARERLRKWEARYALLTPQRSAGGFRVYSLEDERRVLLMQRHLAGGYAAAEAAELAREGIVSPSPARLASKVPRGSLLRTRELMAQAVRAYDEGAAQRALDELFSAFSVEAVIRDGLMPLLREIGEGWARGETSPGQEHFVSSIIEARLMAMTPGWGSGTGPRVLLACPPGERHTLGLIAFGIALSRRGWRVVYLGADTPIASLAAAAEVTKPAVVVLAVAQASALTEAADELGRLASTQALRVAGAGAIPEITRRIGAQRVEADPVTAAAELAA